MYYLPWTLLVIISLWASVAGFIWALRSGQLAEQNRARYLPLRDQDSPTPVKDPGKFCPEVYFLLTILGIGCAIFLLVLFWTLWRLKGG
jgi:nitrogen fixation-related uncharacterized protein